MLTYILIGINVVVGLGAFLSGASVGGDSLGSSRLLADGWLNGPQVAQGEYWRLLTSGFLHYGIFHLLLNMYALYILGMTLEPRLGRWNFGFIYFLSLLSGSLGALLLSPDAATAGASGAVFGLMGAALVLRDRMGFDPSSLLVVLGLNMLLTFALGFSVGGHVGGFVGGAAAAWLLFELPARVKLPDTAPFIISGLVGVATVAASIAIA